MEGISYFAAVVDNRGNIDFPWPRLLGIFVMPR